MSVSVAYDLRGLPELQQWLEKVEGRQLNNRMRRGLRAGAREFRTHMRQEARSRPDLPRTFAKTRTRAHRNPLGVSVSPKSPLSNIFEHGAKVHPIAPNNKPVLAGVAGERGRESDFFAPGVVTHPGMKARPFIAPVFEKAQGDAERAFSDTIFEGVD